MPSLWSRLFSYFHRSSTGSNAGSARKQWLNLKGQPFTEPSQSWYHLKTSRLIRNQPNYSPVYSIQGVRVLGTLENIRSFYQMNSDKFCNITSLESVLFRPFDDVIFCQEDACLRSKACFDSGKNKIVPLTTTDTSDLTDKQTAMLTSFSLAGLFLKGKVTKVIDGDTLEVVVFVPLTQLARQRDVGCAILPTTEYDHVGFFSKVTIRCYGYDAAEKDTKAGQLAKLLLEEKLQSLNNTVWIQFVEVSVAEDKFGRSLAVLFEDSTSKTPLVKYLLEQEKQRDMKMLLPYLGGSKKKF